MTTLFLTPTSRDYLLLPHETVSKVAEGVKLHVLSSLWNQITKTFKIRSLTEIEAVGAVQYSCTHACTRAHTHQKTKKLKDPGNATLPKSPEEEQGFQQTESKKRWANTPPICRITSSLLLNSLYFVFCLFTHLPLPNPPWPDKQAGGPVFPGTGTWKTLSTNFTQAGGGVQKDSLEV